MMSEETKELKKELAKRKRMAVEIASEIHDIVEDTLWTDYDKMPELSQRLVAAVADANAFKAENGL
jgi:tRNA nucleotidyltransferase (CCA-adding enzyme)